MTATQIILYAVLALVVVVYLRRFLIARSIKHYEPSEASELSSNGGSAVLLDVRTDSERRAQHIKGSVHVPLNELRRRMDELKKYKNREVICYCRSGSRSLTAAAMLRKQGFTAANMRGGLEEWNFRNIGLSTDTRKHR
ncbi:MAG: rhodanese-like domain-containing protein [Ignavibacteria bacterium]|nr:rhodanese-like domain-containing protein [Ignavibacteria bacterium]